MVANLLGTIGAPIKARVMMYKAVLKAVLMYGSERWVVMDEIMAVLEVFHHSISRRIVGITEQRGYSGEC